MRLMQILRLLSIRELKELKLLRFNRIYQKWELFEGSLVNIDKKLDELKSSLIIKMT